MASPRCTLCVNTSSSGRASAQMTLRRNAEEKNQSWVAAHQIRQACGANIRQTPDFELRAVPAAAHAIASDVRKLVCIIRAIAIVIVEHSQTRSIVLLHVLVYSNTIPSASAMASRLFLPRMAPTARTIRAPSSFLSRSFRTSPSLLQEAVIAPPVKKPVGAFRGG